MRDEINQKKGTLGAMELTREQLDALYDLTVVSDDGHTLGPVGHIYLDDHTQQATWITAKTGLFGMRQVFIPFQGARIEPDTIKVRYTKDYILDAPRYDTDGQITEAEQDELFGYFRLRRPGTAPEPALAGEQPQSQDGPVVQPPPGQPPVTPATHVPDQAAAHPQQVRAEAEEVVSHGALVDPVADDDPLVDEPEPERTVDTEAALEDAAAERSTTEEPSGEETDDGDEPGDRAEREDGGAETDAGDEADGEDEPEDRAEREDDGDEPAETQDATPDERA